jgi:hypothetical protein
LGNAAVSRILLDLAVGGACLVATPIFACAGGTEPNSHTLALGYFAQEIEDATRFDGRRPGIRIDLVDLNDDGCADAIVVFRSAFLGGARGCSTYVLDMAFDPPREVGGMLTCGIAASTGRTNGWRDLRGDDGGRWKFADGLYRWRER